MIPENVLNIFLLFFKAGLFCFGGGNTMIGVFEKTLVTELSYLTSKQYADMIAISQITPGPVAVNLATFTGAVLGETAAESLFLASVATIAITLPAFFYVLTVAIVFKEFGTSSVVKSVMDGIKPGIIGLITTSIMLLIRITMLSNGSVNYKAAVLSAAAFIVALKLKPNSILILISCGFIGMLIF